MNRFFSRTLVVVAVCACAASAAAQDPGGPVEAQARPATVQDAEVAAAARPGLMARSRSWATSMMVRGSSTRDGFYPEMGGMIPGAGFSAGAGYRQQLTGGGPVVDASAAVSMRGYRMAQSQISWPGLLNDRLTLGGQMKYQDFTQVNFFGIGPDSLKRDQTDYRLNDLDALGFATLRSRSWLSITGRAGLLRRVDVARGKSAVLPSTDERFDDASAPGVSRQPNYLHTDVAIDADTRDVRGYPARGGHYRLSMAMFHDQDFARYSFRRIEANAAQYIPLGRSVLAVRGRIDLSQTGPGQTVPFYLIPTLGGASSLRGYLDYRFRDRDALLLGAEYRWPIFPAVDAAAFSDAGSVAPDARGLSRHLNTDYGVGIRVHSTAHLLARFDVARSNEGTRALLTFTAPLSLPNRTIAPYVP